MSESDGVRRTEAELSWRLHVDRQAVGELSVREYCRRHGLSMPSFYSWRKALRKRDAEKTSSRINSGGTEPGLPGRRGSVRATRVVSRRVTRSGSPVAARAAFVAVDVIGDVIRPADAIRLLEIAGPHGVVIRMREDADVDVLQRVITACIPGQAVPSKASVMHSGEVESC